MRNVRKELRIKGVQVALKDSNMESQELVALVRQPRRAYSPAFSTFIPHSQPFESVEDMVAAAARIVATGDGRKLDNAALALIVDWLEVPKNFHMLNGLGSCTENGVRHLPKKTT